MKATEAIEDLERIVTEFGDGDLQIPDPIEPGWHLSVDRIEFDSERQAIQLINDRS